EGNTITFSRGGSDISGAVVAAATAADLYENWTDMDHVYVANPDYISDPEPIKELSYTEMRELAYIGFSIIHPEALEPLFSHRIPIRIANTDNPLAEGTMVLAERTHLDNVITGIAGNDDFCTINIRRVLLNQERGILLKILTIFNELDINIEHVPTGIDSLSIIVRGTEFSLEDEVVLRGRLQVDLGMDDIEVTRNLAIVMIVGEGMRDTVGVIARATEAIARENISIEVIMSDYHEISCIFMMSKYEMIRAMHGLYNEFFPAIE
ncbi:MAG: aspartate kinase, partial [Clostridiaceae bacterium]|nr:aspartate kinase [Clostridiaceae bacterium]